MDEGFATHTCKRCGPKLACLFTPHALKMKSVLYLKCTAEDRKKSKVANPAPAAGEGHHFDGIYGRKDSERQRSY